MPFREQKRKKKEIVDFCSSTLKIQIRGHMVRKEWEQLGAAFLTPWELAPRLAPSTRMWFSGE